MHFDEKKINLVFKHYWARHINLSNTYTRVYREKFLRGKAKNILVWFCYKKEQFQKKTYLHNLTMGTSTELATREVTASF